MSIGERFTRRTLLAGVAGLLTVACTSASRREQDFAAQVAAIRHKVGGRIAVHALDTGSGLELGFEAQQRFAMCSTFKLLLGGAILARAEAGELSLDGQVRFSAADMLSHAPVTSKHLERGSMSVRELCAATIQVSDNPAANLLLNLIGGPAGFTRFMRDIGDDVTRLDRTELALNTNLPGDPRDTTTAHAMAHSVARLLTGKILSEGSRHELTTWMKTSSTGLRRLRAGLPVGWEAGDKTGTGANGAVNDVLIAWRPHARMRAPIIAAVYMSESPQPLSELESAHAQIAGVIAGIVTAQ